LKESSKLRCLCLSLFKVNSNLLLFTLISTFGSALLSTSLFFVTFLAPESNSAEAAAPLGPPDLAVRYSMDIQNSFLTMSDGVRIAVTYYLPKPLGVETKDAVGRQGAAVFSTQSAEKFPVLFEMIPYRKDDSFYGRDYSLYSYFVERGFLIVKADVRGTGGSDGVLPNREYSDEELADAQEIIRQIAKHPQSSGKVGMFGISWGAFNAIMTSMDPPKELKAILAADGSDDLYHDDVHWIDGILHVDEYEMSIDHENAFPQSPEYRIDEEYLKNRFNREPWIFTYKRNSKQSEFWKKKSLRGQYHRMQLPAFLIGGLLDGYRDSIPRMLENVKVPLIARMGPWNHAWPDNGEPAPNYEWRAEAIRWWNHWLKDEDTGILQEPRFAVFVRGSQMPDKKLPKSVGDWAFMDWPNKKVGTSNWYPQSGGRLSPKNASSLISEVKHVNDPLSGVELGFWWGEPTGDVRKADEGALVFDSEPLTEDKILLGLPIVFLHASVNKDAAHFIARVEDVFPDGTVAFVTGGALNGLNRVSAENPSPLKPGEWMNLKIPLRVTTWTLKKGHRLRVAITNNQFPMFFAPMAVEMKVKVGTAATRVELPFVKPSDLAPQIPRVGQRPWPFELEIEPRKTRPGFSEGEGLDQVEVLDAPDGLSRTVRWVMESDYSIDPFDGRGPTQYRNRVKMVWTVSKAIGYSFLGKGIYSLESKLSDSVELTSNLRMDTDYFKTKLVFEKDLSGSAKKTQSLKWIEEFKRY